MLLGIIAIYFFLEFCLAGIFPENMMKFQHSVGRTELGRTNPHLFVDNYCVLISGFILLYFVIFFSCNLFLGMMADIAMNVSY
ncbi:hypothetical protein BKA69DRAFT_1091097 [Paraphysoderma sedebokerense]|nr:hypothetical protein BKA69DRAFT_1091097 [Paraphysoderma sedebokerense]